MLLPKIEKITRDATISHFFLMFGYKLFSLYFPLFLVARGMSLPEVGYTYLLIYLPIALFAPIASFLNHKINPAILASLGILGYSLYALGMILIQNPALFYFWQVLLGISAALFFVSSRAILMGSKLENPDRAFGWFYTAPFYADAFAPAVGALFIWKFNFFGVFVFSLVLQFLTAIFCFTKLKRQTVSLVDKGFKFRESTENYQKVFQKIKGKRTFSFLSLSLSVLLLAGFYHAFFILFLKENLFWSQNQILLFGFLLSLLFLPVSLWVIKQVAKFKSEKNILRGSAIAGTFSVLFGLATNFLNFFTVIFLMIGKSIGALMAGSGRSGLFATKLRKYPEESAAIDTIFVPLGTALGALIGGLIVGALGFPLIFILGGILILITGSFGHRLAKT